MEQVVAVTDLVDGAVAGKYNIPEFQREFVWKPSQVAFLLDSLSKGYPIGCLVVWQTSSASPNELWIVDGQQRTTALSIMHGKNPTGWNPAIGALSLKPVNST